MIDGLTISISFGSLIALCSLIWGIYVYLREERKGELADSESRKRHHQAFKDLLAANRFDYASYLQSVLGKVDNLFSPREFSVKSYEVCLLWAFVYPIMLGLLFWLASNQDISGFGLFPSIEEGRLLKASLILILLAATIYSFYRAKKEDGVKGFFWLTVAVGVFLAVAGTIAIAVAGTDAGTVVGVVFFAVAGAFIVAVAGAVAVAVAIFFAVAVAGTVAGTGADTVTIVSISAFVVPIGIIYIYFYKKSILSLFYPPYFIFLMICIIGFLEQPWIVINEISFGIFMFLVVLPMINSVLDFLSLGVTRYFLKKSLRASGHIKKAGYYLFDFAIALLSLLVLIFSLFLAIKAMEWAAGLSALDQPSYDLGALLQRLRSQSLWQALLSPDGWVYMMIFSTFLPSLIHGLAFGGFLLTITRPDSSKLRDFKNWTAPDHALALKEKNEISGYLARQLIANIAFPAIGVVLLAGVIFALLNFFGDIEDIAAWLIGG